MAASDVGTCMDFIPPALRSEVDRSFSFSTDLSTCPQTLALPRSHMFHDDPRERSTFGSALEVYEYLQFLNQYYLDHGSYCLKCSGDMMQAPADGIDVEQLSQVMAAVPASTLCRFHDEPCAKLNANVRVDIFGNPFLVGASTESPLAPTLLFGFPKAMCSGRHNGHKRGNATVVSLGVFHEITHGSLISRMVTFCPHPHPPPTVEALTFFHHEAVMYATTHCLSLQTLRAFFQYRVDFRSFESLSVILKHQLLRRYTEAVIRSNSHIDQRSVMVPELDNDILKKPPRLMSIMATSTSKNATNSSSDKPGENALEYLSAQLLKASSAAAGNHDPAAVGDHDPNNSALSDAASLEGKPASDVPVHPMVIKELERQQARRTLLRRQEWLQDRQLKDVDDELYDVHQKSAASSHGVKQAGPPTDEQENTGKAPKKEKKTRFQGLFYNDRVHQMASAPVEAGARVMQLVPGKDEKADSIGWHKFTGYIGYHKPIQFNEVAESQSRTIVKIPDESDEAVSSSLPKFSMILRRPGQLERTVLEAGERMYAAKRDECCCPDASPCCRPDPTAHAASPAAAAAAPLEDLCRNADCEVCRVILSTLTMQQRLVTQLLVSKRHKTSLLIQTAAELYVVFASKKNLFNCLKPLLLLVLSPARLDEVLCLGRLIVSWGYTRLRELQICGHSVAFWAAIACVCWQLETNEQTAKERIKKLVKGTVWKYYFTATDVN